jgi:uncharacterized protein YdaU (DUF1376 family)
MKRPWVPIYWGDYLADTAYLTQGRHSAYLLFIAYYWCRESLPAEPERRYSITRAMNQQEKNDTDAVVKEFFTFDGEHYHHKRIDYEIAKADKGYQKRARTKQKSAVYGELLKDPRWQKKRLQILERDEFMCQKCHATSSTLHVHHKVYFLNKNPWDYPDDLLLTLCEACHEEEKKIIKEVKGGEPQ